MAIRILAQNGDAESYIIGDGDPDKNPMMLCSVADVPSGKISPPVPFQQHLKWGEFHRVSKTVQNDTKLLARLLKLTPVDHKGKPLEPMADEAELTLPPKRD